MINSIDHPEEKAIPQKAQNAIAELRDFAEGKIWMADDFDAPLDDFSEYTDTDPFGTLTPRSNP